MKKIVVGQQKGGVGKSTLTANIAVALAGQGQRVIIVDADKQQTCVKWASRRQLAGTEPEVAFASLMAKETNASDFIQTLRGLGESGKFDVCLIDVGGRDNRELRASLAIADVLLAPCLPSQADIESLDEFDALVGEVSALNTELRALTVINKATTGLNFSTEIELAANAIAEMEYLERPIGMVTDRPNFRATWMQGQGVHDLPDTKSSLKAKAEIDNIVELL
jgi:chromosome partitioning protein